MDRGSIANFCPEGPLSCRKATLGIFFVCKWPLSGEKRTISGKIRAFRLGAQLCVVNLKYISTFQEKYYNLAWVLQTPIAL